MLRGWCELQLIDWWRNLAECFDSTASFWITGADLPADELEMDIDRAVLAGDLGALRAALSVYEEAALESCMREMKRG